MGASLVGEGVELVVLEPGTAVRQELSFDSIELVFLAVVGAGADVAGLSVEEEFAFTAEELEYWSRRLQGRGLGKLAGSGFIAEHPGVVEAVSRYALAVDSPVVLSADATWWMPDVSEGE